MSTKNFNHDTDKLKKLLDKEVRRLKEDEGMPIGKFAEMLGFSRGAFNRYRLNDPIHRVKEMPWEDVETIAGHFGKTPEQFADDIDWKDPSPQIRDFTQPGAFDAARDEIFEEINRVAKEVLSAIAASKIEVLQAISELSGGSDAGEKLHSLTKELHKILREAGIDPVSEDGKRQIREAGDADGAGVVLGEVMPTAKEAHKVVPIMYALAGPHWATDKALSYIGQLLPAPADQSAESVPVTDESQLPCK